MKLIHEILWIFVSLLFQLRYYAADYCAGECPVNAISQGDGQYVIDADTCISCGTCAGVCPTGAINEG